MGITVYRYVIVMKQGLNRLALSAQQEINILGIDTKTFSITIISAYRLRAVFGGGFTIKTNISFTFFSMSETDNKPLNRVQSYKRNY